MFSFVFSYAYVFGLFLEATLSEMNCDLHRHLDCILKYCSGNHILIGKVNFIQCAYWCDIFSVF